MTHLVDQVTNIADIFLDAFHKLLNAACHRPLACRDKGGVLDEMQLLDRIQQQT